MKEILKLLPKDAEITLETEPNIEKMENDLDIIRGVIEEISQNQQIDQITVSPHRNFS